MKKRFLAILLAAFFVCATLTACSGSDKNLTLKFGGTMGTSDAATEAQYMIAELANEYSGGTLTIEVYPANQLGEAQAQLEALVMGSQDMYIEAASKYTGYLDPESEAKTEVTSMFYVFESAEHYAAWMESDFIQETIKAVESENIHVLGTNFYRLPRWMVSTIPIYTLEDMQGKVFRIPTTNVGMRLSYEALGVNPTGVAWGETFLALQNGTVDATDSPVNSIYDMSLHQVAPYLIQTNQFYDSLGVLISQSTFDVLSDTQKEALEKAVAEAGDWYSAEVLAEQEEYIEMMIADGAEIIDPGDEFREECRAAVQKVIESQEADGTIPEGWYDYIASFAP